MSKVEIKLNTSEISKLLKSEEVANYCESIANGIANRANGNYEVTQQIGRRRIQTRVATADKDTYYRNLHNNSLLKSIK